MTIITQKTAFYVGHIEQLPRHFCFKSQGCFVFGNDAQRHANKGAQQMAEHRLFRAGGFLYPEEEAILTLLPMIELMKHNNNIAYTCSVLSDSLA